jgi:pantetheine-phosphate adenylyltransferase
VVRSASGLCDRLVVATGVPPGKAPLFSAQEWAEMIELVCAKPAVC